MQTGGSGGSLERHVRIPVMWRDVFDAVGLEDNRHMFVDADLAGRESGITRRTGFALSGPGLVPEPAMDDLAFEQRPGR